MKVRLISVLLIALVLCETDGKPTDDGIKDETKAKQYLEDVNTRLAEQQRRAMLANWDYLTNITDHTSKSSMMANKAFNLFQKKQSLDTKRYDWTDFDEYTRRQFEKLAVIGTSALDKTDEDMFIKVSNDMQTVYSSAKVCISGRGCELALDPDLSDIMAHSKNYSELVETWVKWRDASGKPIRDKYITYFTLGNKAAKMNQLPNKKFNTYDDLWMHDWETNDLRDQSEKLVQQLMPLYTKLHAYVRMKLNHQYPGKMRKDGTIPAHLLGNMWAQRWESVMNTVEGVDPYPELASIDVSDALVEQGYTAKRIFELAEKFYIDLGLENMTDSFWKKSVLEKPKDRDIVCHPLALDFLQDDYRIKQCTSVNMMNMIIAHHEMGHIQYFMIYREQPTVFRTGANPGFHEAIGDLMALSVATPKHLQKIGLLKNDINQNELDKINLKFLLKTALDKVINLPYSYTMDKWRWDVFSGKVSVKDMNKHWWKLRGDYQGLSPPVLRSEKDFDPGSKFHIPADMEYIRYFASLILQFQFHKKLCSFGQKDVPLYECDIDGDKEAGLALKQMLQKGASEPWPKQLEELVGTPEMSVQPLLEYFKPLEQFLDKELAGVKTGWTFNVNDYFHRSWWINWGQSG